MEMSIKNADNAVALKVFKYIALVAGIATLPSVCFAYLDPGTGSIIVQSIIASVAAAFAAGSVFWHRVIAFFSGKPKTNDESEIKHPEMMDSEDGSP